MADDSAFFFGIPLIARSAAGNWPRIDALLSLTLQSVLAQTDQDFRVLLAGHDMAPCWERLSRADKRLEFIEADWSPSEPTRANDDGGIKKCLIRERILAEGGGLLMFLDADDLVDRRTVEVSRSELGSGAVGGLVSHGVAIDASSGLALPLPDKAIFDGRFHELCGSSTVARLNSEEPYLHELLGSHHLWHKRAAEHDLPVKMLSLFGGYLVNSGENHSEKQGEFAAWRRQFANVVADKGRPLAPSERHRLGLEVHALERLQEAVA